jgi:hypothetical protein
MKPTLKCNRCRKAMVLTTSDEDRNRFPDREWFRCEQCKMSAYKNETGAHYIPITRTRDAPIVPKSKITAPIENEQKSGDWRLKFSGSKKGLVLPAKQSGLQGLIVHDLRRTAVRNMIRARVPECVAMALSGHRTTSVFRRYAIVRESDLAEAAERLQAHLTASQQNAKVIPLKS